MAEVTGLVLGVLPLAIEVAKRYKAIYRVFARYKNCGVEVIEFQRRLHVEQTTFCNEVHILLACLSGLETASKMIEEKNHHLASDTNTQMKFSKHSGASETACLGIITAINLKLSLMDQFLEKSISHESKSDLFIRTKKKLKFAFAETRLEARLSELVKLNTEFVRISSQIHRLQGVQTGHALTQKPQTTKHNTEQYNAVRKAAAELLDALGEACSVHPEHWAQIQIEAQHVNLTAGDPPFIRFIMAFAQNVLVNPSAGTGPIWIAIESILNDTVANKAIKQRDEVQNAFSNLKMTLEHIIDPPQPPQVTATEGGNSKERTVQPPQALSNKALVFNVADTSLPDFSKNHNFCVHVQQSQPHTTTDRGTCLGYLRRGDTCKHRVSLVPDALVSQTKDFISLARVMALVAQKRHTEQLLQYESLKLARQLASAVLQFHATPLLKDCWRSDDVVFFGMSEKTLQKRLTLTAPT